MIEVVSEQINNLNIILRS